MAMSDAPARHAALAVDRHVLLQAPAGSGKTTVLAQRFLHALASVDEPEQVLAITFTRKAAAEMRERVLRALEDDISRDHPDRATWTVACQAVHAQATRRGWQLAELPQRLRIQTIDSLAHEVARTMPLLGRMQTSLAVIDDARSLYHEAARLALRDGEDDPALRDDLERLLRRLDNNVDQAQRLLAGLLPWRNRWLRWVVDHPDDDLAARVAGSLRRIVASELAAGSRHMPAAWWREAAALAGASAAHRQAAGDKPGNWQAWLAADAKLEPDPELLDCWQAVAGLMLTGRGEPRARCHSRPGIDSHRAPARAGTRLFARTIPSAPRSQTRQHHLRKRRSQAR
jgi:ATP-dependent exoDNAse (exonuclease V) beta subunit